jgi:hypothetical protein
MKVIKGDAAVEIVQYSAACCCNSSVGQVCRFRLSRKPLDLSVFGSTSASACFVTLK